MRVLYWLLGLGNLANGAWMIARPAHWYARLPAAVPDTGPLNEHFVRDIGCAYAAVGLGLAIAAEAPAARRGVLYVATMFVGFHALLHVADLTAGRLPPDHWLIDLPGVFAPAILFVVLCLPRFQRA
jgi:predicted anti-sigma-YlaC factor YlaD